MFTLSDETHTWLPWVVALAMVLGLIAYAITLVAKDPDSMHECEDMCGGRYAKSFKAATSTEPSFCECSDVLRVNTSPVR